jgi:tight adherence protein B
VVGLTVLLLTAAVLLLLLAVRDLVSGRTSRRRAVTSVLDAGDDDALARLGRLDRAFRTTRFGRSLERELVLAGSGRSPLTLVAGGALVMITITVALWMLLAPALGVVGALVGLLLVRAYLNRGKERRREAFIAQMPQLARVLANATHAGLSISTAIALAADEMDEPARSELQRVTTSLTFGNDLETALGEVRERLPSREISVLLSTLLVSARSGGSLVTSLRTIADTLEERKETRREIRSTLAQSVATGYTVIAMGFALLLLLNVLNPGTVREMTVNPLGQAALVFAGAVFAVGFLVIRRMTRIKA